MQSSNDFINLGLLGFVFGIVLSSGICIGMHVLLKRDPPVLNPGCPVVEPRW